MSGDSERSQDASRQGMNYRSLSVSQHGLQALHNVVGEGTSEVRWPQPVTLRWPNLAPKRNLPRGFGRNGRQVRLADTSTSSAFKRCSSRRLDIGFRAGLRATEAPSGCVKLAQSCKAMCRSFWSVVKCPDDEATQANCQTDRGA